VTFMQSGVFRLAVAADGTGTLSAIEGKAVIGDKTPFILKEGQQGNLDGAPVVASKFDRKKGDLFAMWSKNRAKDLGKLAKSFNSKTLQNSALGFSPYTCRVRAGVWAFSPAIGIAFIPCFEGFGSPYGYGYGRSIYVYNPWDHSNWDNYNNNNSASHGDFKSGSVTSSAAQSVPMSAPAPAATAPTTTTKSTPGVVDH